MEFSFDLTADRQHVEAAVKGLIWTIFFYRAMGSVVPETAEFLDVSYPYADIPELDEEIHQKIEMLLAKLDHEGDTTVMSSTSTTPLGSPGGRNLLIGATNNPYANIRFPENETYEQYDEKISSSFHSSKSQSLAARALTSPNLVPTTGSTGYSSSALKNTNPNIKFAQMSVKFYERKKLKKPTWFGKTEEDIVWETWLLNIRVIQHYSQAEDLPILLKNLKQQFEKLIWDISDWCDENKDQIPMITSTQVLPFPYTIAISGENDSDNWRAFIKKMLKDPIY